MKPLLPASQLKSKMKTKNTYPSLTGVKPGNQLRSQRLFQGLAEAGFRLNFRPESKLYSIATDKGNAIAAGLSLDQVEDFWSLSLRATEAHMIEPAGKPRNRTRVVSALMENYMSNRNGILRALRKLEDGPVGADNKTVVNKGVSVNAPAIPSSRTRDPKPKMNKLGMPPYHGMSIPPIRDPRPKLEHPQP